MAIEVMCECGKLFRAKDEYAGRRGMCPACKRIFVVPVPVDLEPIERATTPPPVDPFVPAEWQTSRRQEFADADPPDSQPAKRFWRDPVVVIGAAVPTAILLCFLAYLAWPQVKARTSKSLEQSNQATVHAETPAISPSPSGPKNDSRSPAKGKSRIKDSDMHGAAHLLALLILEDHFKKQPLVENVKFGDFQVERVPDDDRQYPWRWSVVAPVTIELKQTNERPAGGSIACMITTRFSLSPEQHSEGEFSREVVETRSGQRTMHKYKTEWLKEFRSLVASAWAREFQKVQIMARDNDWSEQYRIQQFGQAKERVASQLRVAVDELQEILESTD